MSVGEDELAGGVVALVGGVVVDGAGVGAVAAPGSAELGAGVCWLGGVSGPEVPPVPGNGV